MNTMTTPPIRYAVDVVVTLDDPDLHARVQEAMTAIIEEFQGQLGILSVGMGVTHAFTGEEVVEEVEEVDERRNAATVTDPTVQQEFVAGFEEARDG